MSVRSTSDMLAAVAVLTAVREGFSQTIDPAFKFAIQVAIDVLTAEIPARQPNAPIPIQTDLSEDKS